MVDPLLNELATEARTINAANGWGLDFNPDTNRDEVPGYLALIHSEITEAWTAKTPREAVRELGDVIVRALDLGQLIQPGYWAGCDAEYCWIGDRDLRAEGYPETMLRLHTLTSEALEHYRKDEEWRPALLNRLHVLVSHAWDAMHRYSPRRAPLEVIHEILAANRQRAYRHGGRRT